jgi:hypothetical protein
LTVPDTMTIGVPEATAEKLVERYGIVVGASGRSC